MGVGGGGGISKTSGFLLYQQYDVDLSQNIITSSFVRLYPHTISRGFAHYILSDAIRKFIENTLKMVPLKIRGGGGGGGGGVSRI